MRRLLVLKLFVLCVFIVVTTKTLSAQRAVVSVLDFGAAQTGQQAAETFRNKLRARRELAVADIDLTRAAAKGIGYSGSLNLSVSEARDLGAALATEFFVIGDAQTLRRSSFKTPVYYESYASIFLVSARTGRLLFWERPSFENNDAAAAEAQLARYLADDALIMRVVTAIENARREELLQRTIVNVPAEAVIEEAPEDEKAAVAQGVRLPRPYRRLRPEYPETAARAEAEATVDVVVNVGADGEVGEVEIVRWAGFGLDEVTVATVRQLHFFPAMKNGTPVAMRVMLRYNFRKPPR